MRSPTEQMTRYLQSTPRPFKALERRVISNIIECIEGLPGARATCAAEIIEIGYRLTECKRIIPERNWLPWLDECGGVDKFARLKCLCRRGPNVKRSDRLVVSQFDCGG
jgi:hypothetical protein